MRAERPYEKYRTGWAPAQPVQTERERCGRPELVDYLVGLELLSVSNLDKRFDQRYWFTVPGKDYLVNFTDQDMAASELLWERTADEDMPLVLATHDETLRIDLDPYVPALRAMRLWLSGSR